MQNIIKGISLLAVVLFFNSCSKEKVIHSNLIPSDASVVVAINTSEIIGDAIFDLIKESDALEGLNEGPISEVLKNPGAVGVVSLDRHYLFATGSNPMEVKAGAIFRLSDADLFSEYIAKTAEVEVVTDSIYKVAKIEENKCIVWNEGAAIILYAPLVGPDLVAEAKGMFAQIDTNCLAGKNAPFKKSIENPSHIVTWINNEKFLKITQSVSRMLGGLHLPDVGNAEESVGSFAVHALNFNDGKIVVHSTSYLNENQIADSKSLMKENEVAGLLAVAGDDNPVGVITLSVNQEGLFKQLKKYGVDKVWDEFMVTSSAPIKVKLDYVLKFLKGDVAVVVNGFEEVTKQVNTVGMDDEGNQIPQVVDVKQKVPVITGAVTLNNEAQLKMFMQMALTSMPQEEGIFNYNNEVYFTVKNGNAYFGTTAKGREIIKNLSSSLNEGLTNKATQNTVLAQVNLKKLMVLMAENISFKAELFTAMSEKLSSLSVATAGINERNEVESVTELAFANDQSSLISLIQIIAEVKTSMTAKQEYY